MLSFTGALNMEDMTEIQRYRMERSRMGVRPSITLAGTLIFGVATIITVYYGYSAALWAPSLFLFFINLGGLLAVTMGLLSIGAAKAQILYNFTDGTANPNYDPINGFATNSTVLASGTIPNDSTWTLETNTLSYVESAPFN